MKKYQNGLFAKTWCFVIAFILLTILSVSVVASGKLKMAQSSDHRKNRGGRIDDDTIKVGYGEERDEEDVGRYNWGGRGPTNNKSGKKSFRRKEARGSWTPRGGYQRRSFSEERQGKSVDYYVPSSRDHDNQGENTGLKNRNRMRERNWNNKKPLKPETLHGRSGEFGRKGRNERRFGGKPWPWDGRLQNSYRGDDYEDLDSVAAKKGISTRTGSERKRPDDEIDKIQYPEDQEAELEEGSNADDSHQVPNRFVFWNNAERKKSQGDWETEDGAGVNEKLDSYEDNGHFDRSEEIDEDNNHSLEISPQISGESGQNDKQDDKNDAEKIDDVEEKMAENVTQDGEEDEIASDGTSKNVFKAVWGDTLTGDGRQEEEQSEPDQLQPRNEDEEIPTVNTEKEDEGVERKDLKNDDEEYPEPVVTPKPYRKKINGGGGTRHMAGVGYTRPDRPRHKSHHTQRPHQRKKPEGVVGANKRGKPKFPRLGGRGGTTKKPQSKPRHPP